MGMALWCAQTRRGAVRIFFIKNASSSLARPERGRTFWLLISVLHRDRLQCRIDDLSPIQITPLQTMNQDLSRCCVGSKGDVVVVAHLVDVLEVGVQIAGLGIGEEQDHIDLVVGDTGADLLAAAVGVGQEQTHRQAGGLGDQAAGGVGRADGVLGQHAAVGDAELYHQLFLVVMTHQSDIHTGSSFRWVTAPGGVVLLKLRWGGPSVSSAHPAHAPEMRR